jgi:alpha-galactosidase
LGFSKLGYNHINIDDCWQSNTRNESGYINANNTRFPSGLEYLSGYIHNKSLKFGIYSSAGFKTCQRFPASLGLENIDVASYEKWNVDYLKYDNCYQDHSLPQFRFKPMAEVLKRSNRNIFFSLCEWGRENPATWASQLGGNSWRISEDIRDNFFSIATRTAIAASLWRFLSPFSFVPCSF